MQLTINNKISVGTLIVGSGGAGMRCALSLKENGYDDILIVGTRPFKDAHTVLAAGGINAALGTMDSQDDWKIHAADTFYESMGLADPSLVEYLTKHAPDAIQDLVKYGADFHKEDDGELTQRFFGAHTYRRTVFSGDETGKEIIRVLSANAAKNEIDFIENLYVFDLDVRDNEIFGVYAIDLEDEIYYIQADNVVFATGGYSNLYKRSSSRNRENFGNMIALAINYGAKVADMEMVQFHPTGMLEPKSMNGWLVTEAVRGEGGRLLNKKHERFMEKYDSEKMELSTRDVVARANYFEIMAGRGTENDAVYLDVTHMDKEYILQRFPKVYENFIETQNLDVSKELMEVAPTAHYSMGGIDVDSETNESSIKGLYAIGECTHGVHGANRLGGNSLAEIVVFGKKLGNYLVNKKRSKKPAKDIAIHKSDLIAQKGTQNLNLHKVSNCIRQEMWEKVGIVRNEMRMKEALKKFRNLQYKMSILSADNMRSRREQIVLTSRVKGMLTLSEVIAKSAMLREESRGAHYREDYPSLNDKMNYNIYIHKNSDDEFEYEKKKVPTPSDEFKTAIENTEVTKNYGHLE